jgi:hypothetical protein
VAAKTFRRGCGRADTEPCGNLASARFVQDRKRPAVRAAGCGGLLPARKFVLAHDLAVGFLTPVTGRAGTRCHPEVDIFGGKSRGSRGGAGTNEKRTCRKAHADSRGDQRSAMP